MCEYVCVCVLLVRHCAVPLCRWLNVRNNRIRTLTGPTGAMPQLRYLNAADNDLKGVDGMSYFPGVTYVMLSVSCTEPRCAAGVRVSRPLFCTRRNLDLGNNDLLNVSGLASSCPRLEVRLCERLWRLCRRYPGLGESHRVGGVLARMW